MRAVVASHLLFITGHPDPGITIHQPPPNSHKCPRHLLSTLATYRRRAGFHHRRIERENGASSFRASPLSPLNLGTLRRVPDHLPRPPDHHPRTPPSSPSWCPGCVCIGRRRTQALRSPRSTITHTPPPTHGGGSIGPTLTVRPIFQTPRRRHGSALAAMPLMSAQGRGGRRKKGEAPERPIGGDHPFLSSLTTDLILIHGTHMHHLTPV